ncbi:MAG TPA: dihydroxyacetone kinase subunit L [Clostridiales bacterium]|nr:dihydroxyacetone kinase subunit L [Clostridiales bacterium]
MTFKNKDGIAIVESLITTIQANRDYLSEIDGKIGDGDHGINMNKGFTLCGARIKGREYNMSEALQVLSSTLLTDIGGSMGPLYGVFFEAMADASEGKEEIDAAIFGEMLQAALEEVQEIGNAKRGDKTLLDTLIPAVEAYSSALAEGMDFYTALVELKEAARTGWCSTEEMVARIGRASRLGERSRGVLDAGATSCYLMLHAMASAIQQLIR